MKPIQIALLLVNFYCFEGMAQKLPIHEKKIYISSDKKIFYNKSLPVYFYISSSADPNAPRYQLNSETTPKYANPMYFDTEGINTLRSPSAVDPVTKKNIIPKIDVEYQVFADSKPPSTKIAYNKGKIINGIHFVSDSLIISFDAKDELSGIEHTYISIDSGTYTPAENTIRFTEEKKYVLKYYSLDNTGNFENPNEIIFSVDKTPPVSKLMITGQKFEDILPGDADFEISAEDNISGLSHIYFSIDDSVFKVYTGKIKTSLIKQGPHNLYYYSTDQVNNKEKTNSIAFYIDKTPPQVIEEILGKTFVANGKEFSAGTSKLKITAIDNKAGIKDIFYSINNSPYTKYEKPLLLAGYKGNLLVTSYAVDNVGNQSLGDISNSRKNAISYIDLSAPWVGHSLKGPNFKNGDTVYISNKTEITLEAKDTESGIDRIEYQPDSSDLIKYSAPFTIEKEGYHHFLVFGYDNTENLTRQEFGLVLDITGPEIFERFSSLETTAIESNGKKYKQYPGHTVLFLSATDTKSGFESILFQLNKNPMTPYTREIKGFIPGKLNTIVIKAFDKLGNKTEKNIEFYIK